MVSETTPMVLAERQSTRWPWTRRAERPDWGHLRDASDGAGSPWLVLVREPHQLGVERTHQQLAFGVRLVELAEPNRHVAGGDDPTPPVLDDDHPRSSCVAPGPDESEPGEQ